LSKKFLAVPAEQNWAKNIFCCVNRKKLEQMSSAKKFCCANRKNGQKIFLCQQKKSEQNFLLV
jgi:hypothetical protein